MIVIDASAAVELVLNTATGKQIGDRVADEREAIHAPYLIDVEIVHAIRRMALRKSIGNVHAETALGLWRSLVVERHAHEPFIARIWQLRDNISAYDATYVALAEALPAPLVTADRRLAHAPGSRTLIEVY